VSSLTRRMQRAIARRTDRKRGVGGKDPQFGSKLGVSNPKAKDLLARLAREAVL